MSEVYIVMGENFTEDSRWPVRAFVRRERAEEHARQLNHAAHAERPATCNKYSVWPVSFEKE